MRPSSPLLQSQLIRSQKDSLSASQNILIHRESRSIDSRVSINSI